MLLGYEHTKNLLQRHGISLAKGFYCETMEEIASKSKLLQKPWVLKVVGEKIYHKTEKSLIALDLYDFEHLYDSAKRLEANAKESGLKKGEWGFLLQSQLKGVELIIGGKTDPVFGKTILFGSGGIAVELFKDFSTRVCPISARDAEQMISETKAKAFFSKEGFRRRKAVKKKIVELLLKTSELLQESKIRELDFNPVIADEKNVWVVDAKVVE